MGLLAIGSSYSFATSSLVPHASYIAHSSPSLLARRSDLDGHQNLADEMSDQKALDEESSIKDKLLHDKATTSPQKESIVHRLGDGELKFEVRLRLPEFFYGKNLRLLNNDNPTDRIIYFRHTVDCITQYRYGHPKAPYDIIYAKMTIRNKGVWGDPESIASTTSASVNEFGTSFGEHSHGIPLHFLWIRELWIQFSLKELLCLPFCNHHTLTFGAFPFELGRGIALGSAYALDASDLGFISEYAVDQFAFGGKLSGELVKAKLFYDLYGAILDNKSASFSQTNAKFRGQQYFQQ
jgi:hypothetical protein